MVGEASQQPSDESSDVQATVVSDSPEMGFHGQSASETALLVDLGKVSLTHADVASHSLPDPIDGSEPSPGC